MPGHIVFVRFFLHYPPTFPFQRFAHLKDCDLGDAIRAFEEQERKKPSSRQRARAERATLKKRSQEWEQGTLARPGMTREQGVSGLGESEAEPRRETPAASKNLPPGITPRFPVARFDSQDDAATAAAALQERVEELARGALDQSRLEDVDLWFAIANPRFFTVPESRFSSAELVVAHEKVGRISNPVSATASLEEGLVRFYMPMLLATLKRIDAALDGPADRFVFRFSGRQLDLADAPLRYRLLCELWDTSSGKPHSSVDIDSVMEALYPRDDEAEAAFKDLCKQTRRAFVRANIPLTIRQRVKKIWLEKRPV